MKLFCVQIKNGPTNREFSTFVSAMSELYAKSPSFGGSMHGALVSHHTDEDTVKLLVTQNMKAPDDVTVTEVTTKTLQSSHVAYIDLINDYFLPHNDYPNIE